MNPLVSICIPTYNGSEYLSEAMDAAIAQTYTNLEIVVSDDASTDNTLEIVKLYSKKTKIPVKLYHHIPNGIGSNWNYCVSKANGEYIKFLFQDDVIEPNCILEMVQMALKDKNIGLVYCRRTILYKNLTPNIKGFLEYYGNLHTYWDTIKISQGVKKGAVYLKDRQLIHSPKNKIGEPTAVLLKKECFSKVGFFNEKLEQALDFEYWYRVMKYFNIAFIDKKLVSFRLHSKQASSINKQRKIPDVDLLYKCYYKELFWYVHPKNKLKLLKLHHPIVKLLVKFKQQFNAK